MPLEALIALIGAAGLVFTAIGTLIGVWIKSVTDSRTAKLTTAAAIESAKITSGAAIEEIKAASEDKLTDQLQEELAYYRTANDDRSKRLEEEVAKMNNKIDRLSLENRQYRSFLGEHRELMAENGIALPKWPDGLSR